VSVAAPPTHAPPAPPAPSGSPSEYSQYWPSGHSLESAHSAPGVSHCWNEQTCPAAQHASAHASATAQHAPPAQTPPSHGAPFVQVPASKNVPPPARNVLLAAQVGVAGSVTIEDDVTLAGQVGVAGHITVGKGVIATAQTGIPNSVEPGAFISGYPAIKNRDWLRASAVFRKLPQLKKLVADLERRIRELEDMP
jgi:hypothetical protein